MSDNSYNRAVDSDPQPRIFSRKPTGSQTNHPSPSTSAHEVDKRSRVNRGHKRKLKGDTGTTRTERKIKRNIGKSYITLKGKSVQKKKVSYIASLIEIKDKKTTRKRYNDSDKQHTRDITIYFHLQEPMLLRREKLTMKLTHILSIHIYVSRKIFDKEFYNIDIKIKQPNKDTCQTCDKLAREIDLEVDKTTLKEHLDLHHIKGDYAYKSKVNDKDLSNNDPSRQTITFDMQQCLPTPIVQSSLSINFPKDVMKKLMDATQKCIKQSKVDVTDVMNMNKGKFDNDPKIKTHLLCVNKVIGTQNDKGEFQIDLLRPTFQKMIKDDKKTEVMLKKCFKQLSTPEESAFESAKCVNDFLPSQHK
ncbi:unnamed protein product [Psylliodes chrysocephalus]|uniref:Uncharacterized protein n=1 Tax=Psylliodes chrysocephalus TaxID=3402493 RepID=A0A9P0G8H2_9CUCU|nr:unnamed protein product [Psylliodes chrysocephala]